MITKICELCGKEFQAKRKEQRFCSIRCSNAWSGSKKKGIKHSEEAKQKMSEARKRNWKDPTYRSRAIESRKHPVHSKEERESRRQRMLKNKCAFGKTRGSNNGNWAGGTSYEPYCQLFNEEFRERVRKWFKNCVLCGVDATKNREKLSVHHVNYDKNVCCNNTPQLFVTLCHACHSKTSKSKDRAHWEMLFYEIIYLQFGGKCFYTKEEFKFL